MAAETPWPSLGTLPTPRTPLVGRTAELAAARAALIDAGAAILTLAGPGGVGKTRLALAVAHDLAPAFADGAAFVDLALIADPSLVPSAMAQAVGLRDVGERPLLDRLADLLRPRQVLLLLDNLEQVLDAGPLIASLTESCPAVQIIATSRAPLRVRAEQVLEVEPLTLPEEGHSSDAGQVARADAVVFFVQAARAAHPTFELSDQHAVTVADICRRLDGLPLAIELAAARLGVLDPSALLARLGDRLGVLVGGPRDAPARQRTLRDAIAWSHDLLVPPHQRLFRRLAAFQGGWTIEAAEAVAGELDSDIVDGLAALIDQSLVRRVAGVRGEPRFLMLETVREYALDRLLASGEANRVRRVHADYLLQYAERVQREFEGPDQGVWLDRLEAELANVRAALAHLAEVGDHDAEVRLATALWVEWYYRGPLHEGVGRLEAALGRAPDLEPSVRAAGHCYAGLLSWTMGASDRALDHTTIALTVARAAGDSDHVAFALYFRSLVLAWDRGAWGDAIPLADEAIALARAADPARVGWLLQIALGDLGTMVALRGDHARGIALIEEARDQHRRLGHHFGVAIRTAELGLVEQLEGRIVPAAARYAESLGLLRSIGDAMSVALPMAGLVGLAADAGHPAQAARLLGMLEAIRDRVGVGSRYGPPAVWYPVRVRGEQAAQAALGRERYDEAFAEGRALSSVAALSDAIALAAAIAMGSAPGGGATTPAPRTPLATPAPPELVTFGLSPRELDVLRLLAQRWTDPEIAERLFVSPRTVHAHARSIFAKLGVANRREAAAFAVRHGLV